MFQSKICDLNGFLIENITEWEISVQSQKLVLRKTS